MTVWVPDHQSHDRTERALLQILGDDAFAQRMREGATLAIDELRELLAELDTQSPVLSSAAGRGPAHTQAHRSPGALELVPGPRRPPPPPPHASVVTSSDTVVVSRSESSGRRSSLQRNLAQRSAVTRISHGLNPRSRNLVVVLIREQETCLVGVIGMALGATGLYLMASMGPETDYAVVTRNLIIVGAVFGTASRRSSSRRRTRAGQRAGVALGSSTLARAIGATIASAALGGLLAASIGASGPSAAA